ncbi:MAG: GGDEF domain-containing protein [Blautia sp.]|nr:GGDEF domain-containing protein [Lachnoclostridium sp.]MCM1210837.1 GGDEF domain-containing protein [Blautia sp.]
MKAFSKIKELFSRYILSERFKFKYMVVLYAIVAVHAVLLVLFSILRIWPLVIFNVGSVLLYLKCIDVIKYGYEKNFIKTFYAVYVEIIVHSFVATICIGWRFGFPQYILGLVPFGYYMSVTLMEDNKRYFRATMLGFIAFFSFVGCRMISLFAGSIYDLQTPPIVELGIYIFNSICNFGFLLMVTLIFVIDMQIATNKLHSQNAILDNMASTDPMTGLYNRRSMQVFLDHAVMAEEPFCLVMCDIDNFKRVNDTYGHDFGDVVIKDIANIIQQAVKEHGQVCRWGGEEILLLCIENLDMTCKIAETIRSNVEKHVFTWQGQSIHCTLTLGIATHKKDRTAEATITHADERLYYGKQNGKNRVVSPYDKA